MDIHNSDYHEFLGIITIIAIINLPMQMAYNYILHVNRGYIKLHANDARHNLTYFKSLCNPNVRVIHKIRTHL